MRILPSHVTPSASLALLLFTVQYAGSCTHASEPEGSTSEESLSSLQASARATESGGELAARWNEQAYEISFAEDSFRTFKGHRAFAMMHLAMHDAVNAVAPRYRQHTFSGRDAQADAPSAAAQAAHDILRAAYPEAAVRLEAELSRTLAMAPDEDARSRGVALGHRSAAAHIAARQDDGWDVAGSYEFSKKVGAYRTTPPWNGFVAQPGFRYARPFGIANPSQFRPGPPPPLSSPAYAKALNEVRRFGGSDSRERTDDQTGYAIWWMEFAEGSLNRLARRLVVERQLSLAQATRLFALLSMSLYDTYIAVWDTKYEFSHWRPYSSIREAADDGNPATEPDSTWQPLRTTTPFPEYISAHSAACAVMFRVLRRELGELGPFTFTTTTAPPGMASRRFANFDAAAAECADSRIRLGFHYRYATNAGLQLGRTIADHVAARYLLPERR